IVAQCADRSVANHVLWPRDRKGRNGHAGCEGLQLGDTKGVGQARKDEDISSSKMRSERFSAHGAKEDDIRVTRAEFRLLRTMTDHHFAAWQIEREERIQVFFDRNAPDIHEDRSRQIKSYGATGVKQ